MRRSASTIVGLGIVAALFLAVMSMFYLQQIPTKEDLQRLEDDIRREHGLILASEKPIELELMRPEKEGDRTGVKVVLTMRPDIRKRKRAVQLYLDRIAESIMKNPDWAGRIAYATVAHAPPLELSSTVREAELHASTR